MSIIVEPLVTRDGFAACEAVQAAVLGASMEPLVRMPMLVGIHRSGGMVLGAYEDTDPVPRLYGCLIDLVAAGRQRSRLTVFCGVVPDRRGNGVAVALRREERAMLRAQGVQIVRWAVDPLRSVDAYVALSKLGAVGVAYERDLYGQLIDPANRGLATDRLVLEWRVDSPRVAAILDGGLPPLHLRLGLDKMDVISRTGVLDGGLRRFRGFRSQAASDVLLAEIPEDLDLLRGRDEEAARIWRVGTRDLFETLLEKGYLVTGFVHEAGRSFHVLERLEKAVLWERTE